MKITITSKKYSLQIRDFLRGLAIALFASIVPIIQESIEKEDLTFNFQKIKLVAISTLIAYLSKKFFEPSKQITEL